VKTSFNRNMDKVTKKLKINSFQPVNSHRLNNLMKDNSSNHNHTLSNIIMGNKIIERMKKVMKKSSDFKFVMPKLPPPMLTSQMPKIENLPRPINLGQLTVKNIPAMLKNNLLPPVSLPSSNESFSLHKNKINSLNPKNPEKRNSRLNNISNPK